MLVRGGVGDGQTLGSYTTPEEAFHSLIGAPLPSAYVRDTRIQPLDRNGAVIGWEDDPMFFLLDSVDADVFYVHSVVPYWMARPGRGAVTTWDLLDQALHECLGEPDRLWNAED